MIPAHHPVTLSVEPTLELYEPGKDSGSGSLTLLVITEQEPKAQRSKGTQQSGRHVVSPMGL